MRTRTTNTSSGGSARARAVTSSPGTRPAKLRAGPALTLLCGVLAFGACDKGTTALPGLLVGQWGGDGFSLVLTSDSAAARFNCAFGSFEAPVVLSDRGAFSSEGTFVREIGPAALDNPAVYDGQVGGRRLSLRVVVTDTIFGSGSDTLGPFLGTRGGPASVAYCQ